MSQEYDWTRVSGLGTVYSFTVVHRPPEKAFSAEVPYVIALVVLAEGPCMMSNVVNCPQEAVHIGMAVQVAFRDLTSDVSLPVFEPSEKESDPLKDALINEQDRAR